jgi:hypothetical protein
MEESICDANTSKQHGSGGSTYSNVRGQRLLANAYSSAKSFELYFANILTQAATDIHRMSAQNCRPLQPSSLGARNKGMK